MTGDVIDAIARRIVSRSTHRFVVLPAIADLQFEVRTFPRWRAARGYIGAWRAVVSGAILDMGLAIQRPAWRDDVVTGVALVLMQLAYYSVMLSLALLKPNLQMRDVAALGVIAFVISVVPVAALVLPHRHGGTEPTSDGD